MEKISFELFGLTLLEPLSSLMNWVLAAQCFWYYEQLSRRRSSTARRYWSWFFLAYGISLTFGGFSHLLYHYTGMMGKVPGWSFGLLGVSAGELAIVADVPDERKRNLLVTVIRSLFFAAAVMLAYDFSFKWVMAHTAGLLLFVGVFSFRRLLAGQTGYPYFLTGLALLVLMAAVKIASIDFHPAWFNRDDIAHFLMLGTFWMFYRGILRKSE